MKKTSIIIISLLILSCDSKTYYSDIENPETFLDKHGGKIWSNSGYNGDTSNPWERNSVVEIDPMEDLGDKNGEILSIGNVPKILNIYPSNYEKAKEEYEYPQHLVINLDKVDTNSKYNRYYNYEYQGSGDGKYYTKIVSDRRDVPNKLYLNIKQKTNIPFRLDVYKRAFGYNDEWKWTKVFEKNIVRKSFNELVMDDQYFSGDGLIALEFVITPLSGDSKQNSSDPFKQEIEFTDISWSIERIRDSYNKKFESDTTKVASLSLGPIKKKFEFYMTQKSTNYLTFSSRDKRLLTDLYIFSKWRDINGETIYDDEDSFEYTIAENSVYLGEIPCEGNDDSVGYVYKSNIEIEKNKGDTLIYKKPIWIGRSWVEDPNYEWTLGAGTDGCDNMSLYNIRTYSFTVDNDKLTYTVNNSNKEDYLVPDMTLIYDLVDDQFYSKDYIDSEGKDFLIDNEESENLLKWIKKKYNDELDKDYQLKNTYITN